MSMQYIVNTHNLQNITETDHDKEHKSALVEWFMANTDNPPTTATILRNAMLNYLLQF